MYCRIYFDTVSFRLIGDSFQTQTLPQELRDRILISPLTLYEIWSQLTIGDGESMLKRVQSLANWTNPKTGLLPWPDDAVYAVWHKRIAPEDGFTKRMETACNLCLAATSPSQLKEAAQELKTTMDKVKSDMAFAFGQLMSSAKQQSLSSKHYSDPWFQGIARRAKAD